MSEPKHSGILKYEPSLVGNVALGAIYAIEGLLFIYYIARHKNKWALCLPIGALASAVGFFLRLMMDPDNFKLTLYIAQQGLVVISPSAFLAFNYLLYGRFIIAIDPEFGVDKAQLKSEKSRYSFIPPRIVGRTFVWSDAITFFIQMSAGGLQASGAKSNSSLVNVGDKMFLVGVSAQGISYCLFTTLLTVAVRRLINERRRTGVAIQKQSWFGLDRDTAVVVGSFYASSLFIIIRSIYRVVEFTQGYQGELISKEIYLFVLDAVPLVLAIGVWAVNWPTVLLDRITAQVRQETQAYVMEVGDSSRHHSNERGDRSRLV
ncbi:MAG: RTA1 like protein-domain-containing protein [Linnemannia elongata]|nr:MAG: RTA1 like protein-domain-containing protein [Linnemannia elongata]